MGGYADRRDVSIGVLDDLEANLLLLRGPDGGAVLWITLDTLAVVAPVSRALAAAAGAAAGVPPDDVVVAASHTHSGPAGWHGEIHPVLPGELDQVLVGRLVAAVAEAAALLRPRLAPVRASWAEATVQGVGSNRHDPSGPHDPTVGCLSVTTPAGEPVAVMLDHACHPTVLGPENLRWSADWIAGARRTVRAAVGDGVPVLVLQGAAGEISPRFERRGRDHAEAQRLGDVVGTAALTASRRAVPVDGEVSVHRTVLDLRVRTVTEAADGRSVPRERVAHHADAVPARSLVASRPAGARRLTASIREGLRSADALRAAELPGTLRLPVSVVTLGPRRWLHLPVELGTRYGMSLASADLRVVGYSDDYAGYVVDGEAHRLGRYEALASFLDAATSDAFVASCASFVGRS